jgi:UDP-N-acetylmuramoyl-L-alanyl-D-glutamate--2,6-diaminopimelate ligase
MSALPRPATKPIALDDLLAGPRLGGVERAFGATEGVAIRDVADDSREAAPGVLFAALPGARADGRAYLAAALEAGASAALVGLKEGESLDDLPGVAAWRASGRPLLASRDARRDLALLASDFHRRPDQALKLVGVTGTNGKSTTVCLVRQIACGAGLKAAELGTLGWRVGRDAPYVDAGNTTPGAVGLARLMRSLVDDGVQLLAMEVSSHAIDQRRVWGLAFDACGFTNLTQDHLDYHASMQEYAAVKRGWFEQVRRENPNAAIVANTDDAEGRAIAKACAEPASRLWTYGLERANAPRLHAAQVESIPEGTSLLFRHQGKPPRALSFPLRGAFNVQNALGALGLCFGAGIAEGDACRELGFCQPPPGRFQPIQAGQPFSILVDYAHTPDALERLLVNARELMNSFGKRREAAERGVSTAGLIPNRKAASATPGEPRLTVVFGCGGDRDRGKRPLMGAIAARLADGVIVTSDNPRSEDPMAIIREIQEGAGEANRLRLALIPDRGEAIRTAIADAAPGEVVAIAGKGHETYQEVAGKRHPFDDADVALQAARAWLATRAAKAGPPPPISTAP